MQSCSECAFRKQDGYCLMRRERCPYVSRLRGCPDRVARVSEALHLHMRRWWAAARDLSTKGARMRFRTRHAESWDVFQTCRKKRRFRSFNAAMEMAVHLFRRKGLELAVYECPYCGGWHLTRQLRPNLPSGRSWRDYKAAVA